MRFFSGRAVVLNRATIAAANADFGAVAELARALLLEEPGIAAAYTRAQLESGSAAGQPFFAQMRRTWHREISGDVEFVRRLRDGLGPEVLLRVDANSTYTPRQALRVSEALAEFFDAVAAAVTDGTCPARRSRHSQ